MTVTDNVFSTYDLISDLAANRPATPVVANGRLSIFLATDTGDISIWNGTHWSVAPANLTGGTSTPFVAALSATKAGADSLTLRSGATGAGNYCSFTMGRTGNDFQTVVLGATNDVITGGSAGDTAFNLPSAAFLRFCFNGVQSYLTATGASFYLYGNGVGPQTTAAGANAVIAAASNFQLQLSTSSIRFKTNVVYITTSLTGPFVDQLKPITYQSLSSVDDPSQIWFGLLAEDVAKVNSNLCTWTPVNDLPQPNNGNVPTKGLDQTKPIPTGYTSWAAYITANAQTINGVLSVPNGVQYDRLCVQLIAEAKQLRADRTALQAAVTTLQTHVATIAAKVGVALV